MIRPGAVVRRASIGDLSALVALRAEMFRAMGTPQTEEPLWQSATHQWFTDHIADDQVFIVVVEVDHEVVATAMAAIRDAMPSPSCPAGRDVLITNVCTLPTARRQGFAREAFEAVMRWAGSTGIGRAELMATGDGQAMYESAGFTVTAHPAMRATLRHHVV